MQNAQEHILCVDLGGFQAEQQRIQRLLRERGISPTVIAGDPDEVLKQLAQASPDVLIIVDVGTGLGAAMLERVQRRPRGPRTLLVSDRPDSLSQGASMGAAPLPIPFTDELFWSALALGAVQPTVRDEPRLAAPPSRHAALRALADSPISEDRADALAFGPYADALAALIENPETGTPLTVAINAPWGAGKSSLARMIERRLTGDNKTAPNDGRPHIVCWFNAWMHDDAPNLATAFAAHIARVANQNRSLRHRLLDPLPRALWSKLERRLFWASIVGLFTLLFVTLLGLCHWFLWTPALELADLVLGVSVFKPLGAGVHSDIQVLGVSGLSIALTTVAAQLPRLLSAARSVASYLEDPEAAANLGNIAEVRAQLGTLLAQARDGERRFVVFVDDLERCRPPRAVDLLEVVNQLIDHPGVVVVIMADMDSVAACAELKYKDIASRYGGATWRRRNRYGRLYLQKIIQLQFDLPPHPPARLFALIDGVTRPAESRSAVSVAQSSALGLHVFHPVFELYARPYRRAARWLARCASSMFGPYLRTWQLTRYPLDDFGPDASRVRLLRWFVAPAVLVALAALTALRAPLDVAVYLGAMLIGLVSSAGAVERWQCRVEQDRTRRLIDRELAAPDADPAAIGARLGAGDSQKAEEFAALIRERKWLHVMNDAHVIKEAYVEVAEYLSRHPRATKRFVNHLRVLVAAASARKALGGEPCLEVKHLARFILFRECWPVAAHAVQQRPELLAELERSAGAELRSLLETLDAEAWDAPALGQFLASGVQLGAFADRLVHLVPASAGGASAKSVEPVALAE